MNKCVPLYGFKVKLDINIIKCGQKYDINKYINFLPKAYEHFIRKFYIEDSQYDFAYGIGYVILFHIGIGDKNRVKNYCRSYQRDYSMSKCNNKAYYQTLIKIYLTVCVLRAIKGRGNDLLIIFREYLIHF